MIESLKLPVAKTHALRDLAMELVNELIEHFHLDGARGWRGVRHLPQRYLLRYDRSFAKNLVATLIVVTWKLLDPREHWLSSTAEELALRIIVSEAFEEGLITQDDVDEIMDLAYQDADHEFLYDDSMDGIEDSPTGEAMSIGGLRFSEWFRPFNPGKEVTIRVVEPERER